MLKVFWDFLKWLSIGVAAIAIGLCGAFIVNCFIPGPFNGIETPYETVLANILMLPLFVFVCVYLVGIVICIFCGVGFLIYLLVTFFELVFQ